MKMDYNTAKTSERKENAGSEHAIKLEGKKRKKKTFQDAFVTPSQTII